MDKQTLYFLVMGVAVILGIAFTVVYYFARYYVKTDDDDQEVVPSLRTPKADENIEAIKARVDGAEPEKVLELEAVPEAAKPAAPNFKKETSKPTDLKSAMSKTRNGFWGRIESQFRSARVPGDDELEALEEVLYTSDIGPHMANQLYEKLGDKVKAGELSDIESLRNFLKAEMRQCLNVAGQDNELWGNSDSTKVWMIVGVNGVGKTTTIGKLASQAKERGWSVLVAAGDTFRAAADQQLEEWAKRAGVEVFTNPNTKDPSAVAYGALEYAKSKKFDLVIVDTAGRLHTQDHLMQELTKTKNVMKKIMPEAPDEVFLVVDGNSGQNALQQGREFHKGVELTGIAVTKLDGTSKGGVVIGLVSELGVPVRFIGVGEMVQDLRTFNAEEFVESIL